MGTGKKSGKDRDVIGGQSHGAQDFVELKVSPGAGASAGCFYEVVLSGGRRVRVGHDFDPDQHQALLQVDSEEYESGKVVEEHLKGYKLNDKVIRHTQVLVAK